MNIKQSILIVACLLVIAGLALYFSSCGSLLPSPAATTTAPITTTTSNSTTTTLPFSSQLLYKKQGEYSNQFFAAALSSAGDINSDGKDDFIVASGYSYQSAPPFHGFVSVYSGADGSLVFSREGESASGGGFGYCVAKVGNVNGDGIPDFLVGAYDYAYLLSGKDGGLIYKKNREINGDEFGFSLSSAGDVNGDGKPDYIIGANKASRNGKTYVGKIYVYSGADGSLLFDRQGESANDQFGYAVSSAGDINGDGKAEILAGAINSSYGGKSESGSVYVISGADNSILFHLNGETAGDQFGNAVSPLGDVNGDGKPDFLVGAYSANPAGKSNAGSVYIYSGADGTLLYRLDGEAAKDEFGCSLAAIGDQDGDGVADFIVGAQWNSPSGKYHAGAAYVFSGKTGRLLCKIEGENGGSEIGFGDGDQFGLAVASAGDINGDGKEELMVGTTATSLSLTVSNVGTAYVYSISSTK